VKFIPWLLTAEQKEHHLSVVSLNCGEADENLYIKIVICDGNWLYCCDPETEQISTMKNIFITMTQGSVPSLMDDKCDAYCFFQLRYYSACICFTNPDCTSSIFSKIFLG
jgi:hypothetical protein